MIRNAKEFGKVYFGLHMVEGVAEYCEPNQNGGKPYRVLIDGDCLKDMDPGFAGRPIYVRHVNAADPTKFDDQLAGHVIKSFYNPADGKHWVQFIITEDIGHDKIKAHWKLSNAYQPLEMGPGGRWHNVEYLKKVVRASYDHLALVPDPRYEESIILTPEEFRSYNSEKESELLLLANSKETSAMPKFNFFKKAPVEAAAALELETMALTLKNGKEMTIPQIVNALEDMQMEKENAAAAASQPQMANGDHKVKVGESEMTVNELIQKYQEAMAPKQPSADEMKANAEKEAADKKAADEAAIKKNADDEAAKKKAADDEAVKKNGLEHFEKLRNAMSVEKKESAFEGSDTQVGRGKARYGS